MTTTIPAVAETEEARVAKRFANDISEHVMTVLHEDGLYRHVRFKHPDTRSYFFDLVTWPGYLTISGDMGCYTFSRLEDMFEFFTAPTINPQYWAEKLQNAADVREFSPRVFKEYVKQAYNYHAAAYPDATYLPELWDQITDQVLWAEDEHVAHDRLAEFKNEHFDFEDAWEWDLTEYTYRFLWICHAVRWGVEQYKAALDHRGVLMTTPERGVVSVRYCPAFGPGSQVCPRSICDCFIDQFPDDMQQAGALHPEFFVVTPTRHDMYSNRLARLVASVLYGIVRWFSVWRRG